jgi:hypothetical protein
MKAQLLIAGTSRETGALLEDYLIARGVDLSHASKNVISYGVRHLGALNGCCGRGKIFNMSTMKGAGVQTVPFYLPGDNIPANAYPLLARKTHGYGGTDLVPIFQKEEIDWRVASGWDWFSSYIPIEQEYRVWVFRDKVLDTYKKQMNRPAEYKYIGRNFRNGFDFVPTPNEYDVSVMAIAAVNCLSLDFAAVDCLRGKNGRVYILETNTAPGVIKSGAQKTLAKLADLMVMWLKVQQYKDPGEIL